MASNGISNGALRSAPISVAEYDKKTSAQALFSSDGEEDATESRKQLEGVRTGSKDALSCRSRQSPGPSDAMAHPTMAQGLHDQQQMMAIQYLPNQLHLSQQAPTVDGPAVPSKPTAQTTDQECQTDPTPALSPPESSDDLDLTSNDNDRSSKQEDLQLSTDNVSEANSTRVEY